MGGAWGGGVGVAFDEGYRASFYFAHGQLGCRGQFIGYGDYRGAHTVAVGVVLAAVVDEGLEAGDADSYVNDAVAPGAPEGVGDYDGHVHAGAVLDSLAEAGGGGVGVFREEGDDVAAGDVGGVYARVGADEAVAGLGYEHTFVHAHHAHALSQHHLHLAGIFAPAVGVVDGEGGRLDLVKVDTSALGLADDLLSDDQNVAGLQAHAGSLAP